MKHTYIKPLTSSVAYKAQNLMTSSQISTTNITGSNYQNWQEGAKRGSVWDEDEEGW